MRLALFSVRWRPFPLSVMLANSSSWTAARRFCLDDPVVGDIVRSLDYLEVVWPGHLGLGPVSLTRLEEDKVVRGSDGVAVLSLLEMYSGEVTAAVAELCHLGDRDGFLPAGNEGEDLGIAFERLFMVGAAE